LIFEYKPDILADISSYVQKLVHDNKDTCILDSAGKTVIRFSTPTFDKLIPAVSEGWSKNGRILMYEFYNYDNRLAINLILGPGDPELRNKIFSFTSQKPELFKLSKGKINEKWKSLYQFSFLKKKDFEEVDFETLKEKISSAWNKFLTEDMIKIDDYFQDNWQV
jgi:hypothetical protein